LVWSYQRTSTTRQARDDRSGMERQDLALAQWLKDHPEFELQDRLVDPGVSAGKGVHRTKGALGRFLAAAKAGQVPSGSVLIIESVSRFSREASSSALQSLLGGVFEPGLAIAFTGYDSGKVITSARWDDEPGLKYGLIAALDAARVEWEEKSSRSKGAARKRERLQEEGEKVAAATPWWIQRDHERRLVRDTSGSLLIDPTCKATILRAVELACGGMGSTLIAEALNNEQFPLPQTAGRRNQYSDRAGDRWGHGRVAYLLRHPALLGDLVRRDGRTIAGFYPPVLSIEKWHELRGSIEARDKLRGSLRGGGQKVNNLFMGITRCGDCGGPFSFHDSSERARIDHPGYMACRAANRRSNPTCSNSGYLNYSHLEAHCLTRLMAPIWADLLGSDLQQQEVSELREQINTLAHTLRTQEAQLERNESRFKELWSSGASPLKQELVEKAVAEQRQSTAETKDEHNAAAVRLQLLAAKPTGAAAAADLKAKITAFWQHLDEGLTSPTERRGFNRWLRCHQPQIQFVIHPAKPGARDREVELVVGGASTGTEPLAPVARRMARAAGVVEPYAKDFSTSQGESGVIAWQEPLGPEELENWPSH
jgi:hypothetical protein